MAGVNPAMMGNVSGPSDDEVKASGMQWGADERAIQFVLQMPPRVRAQVVKKFNPPADANVSGMMIAFAKGALRTIQGDSDMQQTQMQQITQGGGGEGGD